MNFEMKLNPKMLKTFKKLQGEYLGRQIAFGRDLIKSVNEIYNQPERLNPEDVSDDVCDSLNSSHK